MELQYSRRRLSGRGLVVAGVGGAVVLYIQNFPLAGALLFLGAVAGVFALLQKQKAYAVSLVFVGFYALATAFVGFLSQGDLLLTILYLLLAVVALARGWQGFR
ncbi:hypothetical protein [Haloferax sp. DFSO60]|uniref:hypothetical protein n=1 Tax=Haloferax sp. DFSO60 TaxID=3388652 RepID=UPI00397B1A61